MKKCKDCIYFIDTTTINNCKLNIIGTTKPEDSACYKINDQKKYEIIENIY